jgi:hypothetical protein
MEFRQGDRIEVVKYPVDDLPERERIINRHGTIVEFDGLYWRATLDGIDDTYGLLFLREEIQLLEIPYDPTQMGDTDDDI